jgi:N-acetyl sugar amidotransferase
MMFQQCTRCVIDTIDDPRIEFDQNGVCNYCHFYDDLEKRIGSSRPNTSNLLEKTIEEIKRVGEGKQYDCIVGLSGGTDSSYMAHMAKTLGLRPLAVHLDNGWNSELAAQNIEKLTATLDFDLFTYVIDWPEFRDLQLAYLKASVIDIEAITDHAIAGCLYQTAYDHGIKYIVSGENVATEAIMLPHWVYRKSDHLNIKAIHREYGTIPLKSFPLMTFKRKRKYKKAGIQIFRILNYLPYNKSDAKHTLASQFCWRDYGGKHYESVFTRFYQGYILPTKFGVDKRKAHLSSLVCAGQMTREEALEEIGKPIYDPDLLRIDREFVLKKFGLSSQVFDDLMRMPPRDHRDFLYEGPLYNHYRILRPFKPVGDRIKKFFPALGNFHLRYQL